MNKDQAIGSFIGLAIGDALGTTLEFQKTPSIDQSTWHTEMTGGGAFGVPPGGWTDDTSMAVALAHSLSQRGCFEPDDVADNFVTWWMDGKHSWSGTCVDIGNTTREALNRQLVRKSSDDAYLGSTAPTDSGNGGIMRLAPTVLINHLNLPKAIEDSVNQSRITHASQECCLYANLLARVIFAGDPFIKEVDGYVLPDSTPWIELQTWGYVKHTFHAAMWAARNSSSFEECVLLAVNLKGDADTMGAVAGQIAGAMYGYQAIPKRWLGTLLWHDELVQMARRLYRIGSDNISETQAFGAPLVEQLSDQEVVIYPQPTSICVSDITMSRLGSMGGSFHLMLDDVRIEKPLAFWVDDEGLVIISLPNLPSFGETDDKVAIELTKETMEAVNRLLIGFLPDIVPISQSNGHRNMAKRVSPEGYVDFYQRLRAKAVLECLVEAG